MAYAASVALGYLSHCERAGLSLSGRRVLELGPGPDLGPALVLAGSGAEVHVADPYLHAWDPEWHPPLYAALAEHLEREHPQLPTSALRDAARREDTKGLVRAHRLPVWRLGRAQGLPDASLDLCLSNAVLEHLTDVPAGIRRLARLTRPDGLGLHQVDFRDHRDFERPLEHLTDSWLQQRWRSLRHRGALGHPWRSVHYARAFEQAGFRIDQFDANLHAAPDYLRDLLGRCRRQWLTLPRPALSTLSGHFVVRRRATRSASAS
ncbi:MAG: hypothetical protein DHS20C15_25360 [Planctomycetota bacterium]|nr:MAG: hypothetical protein DHS20C15_25360 [Planctomycetota bacterium]